MKSLKIYLIAGGILLVLYIIAQLDKPKVINWTETLDCTQKIPYGTYITYNRLKDVFPGARITPYRKAMYNVIVDDSLQDASYIIIARYTDLAQPDYDALLKYLDAGNDVFIAAENFGGLLEKKLGISTSVSSEEDNNIGFVSPSLDTGAYLGVEHRTGKIIFDKIDTANTVVLGQNTAHEVNFIKMRHGKGALYLCSNPLFFTNYSMLQADGQKYASIALSYIKNTKQVVWDEYYTQGPDNGDSMMRVFLDHPALHWAYFIALFTLLTFVLYEIKRRQRIIPVVAPPENTTLSFVTTVGQVYFEKRDNANIANKKILYFLEQLRVEYNLVTNPLNEEFIEALSQKTNIDRTFAAELVNHINSINGRTTVNDAQLITLNKLIEQFYTKSR